MRTLPLNTNLVKIHIDMNIQIDKKYEFSRNQLMIEETILSMNVQIDKKYEFSRNQLIIEETLGEGEFGKVVSAKALNFRGKSGENFFKKFALPPPITTFKSLPPQPRVFISVVLEETPDLETLEETPDLETLEETPDLETRDP